MSPHGQSACWYCGGIDDAACPMCSPDRAPEDKMAAILGETAAVVGQDGWCPPAGDIFGDNASQAGSNLESYNVQLLVVAEEHLRTGEWSRGLEFARRAVRNLEAHFDRVESGSPQAPLLKRGEREAFCLARAAVARCLFTGQQYELLVQEVRDFSRIHDHLVESGDLSRLLLLERKVLDGHVSTDATFVGDLATAAAAVDILLACRQRVKSGAGHKLVMEHVAKALVGLRPMSAEALPGLNQLRANLAATRAQAALELERWEEAKQDALKALELDPALSEAQYMLECAVEEEW